VSRILLWPLGGLAFIGHDWCVNPEATATESGKKLLQNKPSYVRRCTQGTRSCWRGGRGEDGEERMVEQKRIKDGGSTEIR
jgi:ribosomal protein L2